MQRKTIQRKIILDELSHHSDHPTADEIYIKVRKQMPKISLGTVYRNLELLSNAGTILKLDSNSKQMRFDPNPIPHPHFYCIQCDQVEDIPVQIDVPSIDEEHPWFRDRLIQGSSLEFYGLCPECKKAV
jgi:Fur family transcriptional regulator, ferric uptake regulator